MFVFVTKLQMTVTVSANYTQVFRLRSKLNVLKNWKYNEDKCNTSQSQKSPLAHLL